VVGHGARVLLLEAGGDNRDMLLDMPAGAFKILFGKSNHIRRFQSVPQPSLDGRTIEMIQGNVIGGGSSINALAYTRGVRADYDAWDRSVGGAGWGWEDLLPYFTRQESNSTLGAPAHGTVGPLRVGNSPNICKSSKLFVDALQALGVPFNRDFNSGDEGGVGYFQTTSAGAKRCSAANAFLDPIRTNLRLTVKLAAVAVRLIFEGLRAVGVEYLQEGRKLRAYCSAEIILTAGAYATPKLLLLSGIGPAEELQRHGIAVKQDLPGVGRHMQDHNMVPLAARTTGRYGYYGDDRGMRLVSNFIRYRLFGTGPIASNGSETAAFVDLDGAPDPTLQIYNVGTMWLPPDQKPGPGLTLMANLIKPKSQGWMRLRSADPLDPPEFSTNYLDHPDDLALLVRGFRYLRAILRTKPLADIVETEQLPGASVEDDEQIKAYCKATTYTNYHPVGSCRMGLPTDPMAVLDPLLRVRGTEKLRVMDASMMPLIPSANTNAPVMAVADRGIDLMMGRASLRAPGPERA
jgi:choline dehydrogenase-like flavoprotein